MIAAAAAASSPVVGSSQNTTLGAFASATARLSRRACPPVDHCGAVGDDGHRRAARAHLLSAERSWSQLYPNLPTAAARSAALTL